jgi:hypothetical protein
MVEPFSTTDVFYVNADCNNNNAECKYKNNVDTLNALKVTTDTATQQYKDLSEDQSATILSNIGLGIGIFAMIWIMQLN